MKSHETPGRLSKAAVAVALAAAPVVPACGDDEENTPLAERVISYCDAHEVVCVDEQSIDTGFADVTGKINVGDVECDGQLKSCFHPLAGKDSFVGVAPLNRRRVPDEQTNGVADTMQDQITLDPASTRMLRVTKNGDHTLTDVQDSGNGHYFCLQTQDGSVTRACMNAIRAVTLGARDFMAEDTCDFDASIQVDCAAAYDGSVVMPQRNSCTDPEQGVNQTRQALGLPSASNVRFTGQRVFPRSMINPAARYRGNR